MNGASATSAVSEMHLREAERGFAAMLRRKRFTQIWIAEHADDLLGQARKEYAEWLARGRPADNPVGWLIHCAWRRTQNLLESERRKPRPSSIEEVFHLADERTPTPEERALDAERAGRMREAMRYIPDKERALLALVYFEDMTIRDAGQRLGWGKSSADRHHRAALDRLRALLGERSLLGAEIGLAAWIAITGERGAPRLAAAVEHLHCAAEALVHRAAELWRKLVPLGEPASAAAAGNAGRIAGTCGTAAAALCLAGGAVGPGVAGISQERAVPKTVSARPSPAPNPAPQASPTPAVPASPEPASSSEAPAPRASSSPRADVEKASSDSTDRRPGSSPQPASAPQVEADFGFESGAPPTPSAAAEPSEQQAPASAVSSASTEEAPPPAATAPSSAPASPEFGM